MSIEANIRMISIGLIDSARRSADNQLSLDVIRECVAKAMDLIPESYDVIDIDLLIAQFERDYHTFVGEVLTLKNNEDCWQPWLLKNKAEISWNFWERYRTYLLQQQKFSKPVVDSIDEVTDETLGNLTNPSAPDSWDRRGMVFGNVQAGKTTNYAGLICKAVDAGYKVIIVLTGFHNNLRTQTQIRLEEAFVGYDFTASVEDGAHSLVGVGHISSHPDLRVDTITNRSDSGDFSRTVANNFGMNPGGRPLIFVIKKNASVLRNLVKYLKAVHNKKDITGNKFISGVPLLLIDDEADQGSVDTKKMDFDTDGDPDPEHDPTTINKLVRKILFIFTQSAYVGYTATPFANIFIHSGAATEKYGDDLFPRSFITVMPTPSNYIGPKEVFGLIDDDGESRQSGLKIIRAIDDYAASKLINERNGWMPPKHNKNHMPKYKGKVEITPSLRKAIISFVIGCSVRALRGQQNKHNSMLIHVTRFTDVQERVYNQVSRYLKDIQQILMYGEEGSKDVLLEEIHKIWLDDYLPTNLSINDKQCPLHEWSEVGEQIMATAQSIIVRQINGTSGEVLDYEKHKKTGLNVIAIGGDKLSRGLTLEGLTVSYFTRPTRMYDTLMQMGRWFGYRDGFLDVCRLYAPQKLVDWFEHITDSSEQLRKEFLLMCELGGTPANYGQRVKSHPVLMVTSQVKMRHTTVLTCSYQGSISETIVYSRNKNDVESNFTAAHNLVEKIDKNCNVYRKPIRESRVKEIPGKYMWTGVDSEDVLDFLKAYKTPPHARKVQTSLLASYIQKQIDNGDLINWSVLIAGKDPAISSGSVKFLSYKTGLLTRSNHPALSEKPDLETLVYKIRRLVSPSDESWDLTKDQYLEAQNLTDVNRSTRPGGEELRVVRDKSSALLILYPLESQEWTQPDADTEACYIGFAISFPGINNDKPVTYRVNEIYMERFDEI